ncbi:hypothetical protein IU451_29195 [Nocardia cyriacigeorgica]|uniref:hypothetical protein n=1 Tax=Nocardia cyriacigeorgica TaxID=135487 RepID=UPI001893117F|nr:hypothetical protein [Nocardia cyriacigeorgica]MBF6326577.1 hypothetical protein [Nocardia cyriacigeorgica]
MSLADALREFEQQSTAPKPCKTGIWVASLDDESATAFHEFLARGGKISHLHRMAVKWGCDAAETRFRAHCKRDCACYPTVKAAA